MTGAIANVDANPMAMVVAVEGFGRTRNVTQKENRKGEERSFECGGRAGGSG